MFDIKKEYASSLPHYEEALAIKNAIAGLSSTDSSSLFNQANPGENEALVLKSLHKGQELPLINKATLSASVTRQKIAAVYVKASSLVTKISGILLTVIYSHDFDHSCDNSCSKKSMITPSFITLML